MTSDEPFVIWEFLEIIPILKYWDFFSRRETCPLPDLLEHLVVESTGLIMVPSMNTT